MCVCVAVLWHQTNMDGHYACVHTRADSGLLARQQTTNQVKQLEGLPQVDGLAAILTNEIDKGE